MRRCMVTGLIALMMLTGCGMQTVGGTERIATQVDALATDTLMSGFYQIHLAAFSRLDSNKDNVIDEYEAGASFDLRDFAKADKNRNGKLTRREFMDYATGGALFGFLKQDKVAFARQAREALRRNFVQLDANRDRLLTENELTEKALAKAAIRLSIPALRINVVIKDASEAALDQADKTKDKALSAAEFEDFCIASFLEILSPKAPAVPEPASEEPELSSEEPAAKPESPAKNSDPKSTGSKTGH
jgi:hypothetical protein